MEGSLYSSVEETLQGLVRWLELVIEAGGAVVVALGVAVAVAQLARGLVRRGEGWYRDVRLTLGHYLALALEFLLAADILATAIAPSWDQIGKLAAIAAIRTGLNFFLTREMAEDPPGREGDYEGAQVRKHENA